MNIDRYHRNGEYDSPYEGMFSGDSAITGILSTKYSPDHVWSPTILETYASCPFRFFLERVIGIKPLPDVEPNLSAKNGPILSMPVPGVFTGNGGRRAGQRSPDSTFAEATELMLRIAAVEPNRFSFESPLGRDPDADDGREWGRAGNILQIFGEGV